MLSYLCGQFCVRSQERLFHLFARDLAFCPTAGKHLGIPGNRHTFNGIDGVSRFYCRNSPSNLCCCHINHLFYRIAHNRRKEKTIFQPLKND